MCVYTYVLSEILLTLGTNQEELGVTVTPIDHQLKGPIGFEGSDKSIGDITLPAVTTYYNYQT